MSEAKRGEPVRLYIYDISQGMAKAMSLPLLGKQIDAIYHTGLVAYGFEWFLGGGIQAARPGETLAGRPMQVVELGYTTKTQQQFHDFLKSVAHRFTPETYSLLRHNCNNFSDECSVFLVGKGIPSYITGLPEEALNTPMGQMFKPMILQMEAQMKQHVHTSGFIPWSERGLDLELPPITRPSAAPPSSSTSSSSSSSSAAAPSPSHPHHSIVTAIITPHASPLLSTDAKFKSYEVLIKAASRKLEPPLALSETELHHLSSGVAALTADGAVTQDAMRVVERAVASWPVASLFPPLGLWRSIVLRPEFSAAYSADEGKGKEADILKAVLRAAPSEEKTEAPAAAQLMALCTLTNLASLPAFAQAILTSEDAPVLACAKTACQSGDVNLRRMGAALLCNLALATRKDDDSDSTIETLSFLVERANKEEDLEACFRVLLALGTLAHCNSAVSLLLPALDFSPPAVAARFVGRTEELAAKLAQLTKDIDAIMRFEQQDATA